MVYDPNCMHVVFSSDDNYAQHLGAAIWSLLEQNSSFEKICVHIIENGIGAENKKKLTTIADAFPMAELCWLDFSAWKERLQLDMSWPISVSAYARLFVGSMLEKDISRVLYMDCDMIVCASMDDLWKIDLGGHAVGAVQDFVGDGTKAAVGLLPEEKYFNSGLLLIDLDAWREQQLEMRCISFLEERQGRVTHHDQGVLNGVLRNGWHRLPVGCNLMTIHYVFGQRKLAKYFADHAEFYTEEEVGEAKKTPTILHYTPSFTSRPWVKDCRHPLRGKYWEAVEKTPWRGAKKQKNGSKWYVRLIDWRYRNLPY